MFHFEIQTQNLHKLRNNCFTALGKINVAGKKSSTMLNCEIIFYCSLSVPAFWKAFQFVMPQNMSAQAQ